MPRAQASSVLLISLDGFRADYLDRGLTPRLSRIVREGVRAEWMTPTYPSLTFPNHYTVVTGLHPDHHGIVHNTMRDAKLGAFSLGNREAVGNGAWWGGEPIWVRAERAGLPTATYFWPGSEAAIQGVRPTRWKVYDDTVTVNARIDAVLEWLSEDVSTRPRLITLYAETLDDVGHSHGPDSIEMRDGLREVDAAIGRLMDGLAARALLDTVDVVVTSDHGMATVLPGNTVAIEEMVDARDAAVVTTGQSLGFTPQPGREQQAYARLDRARTIATIAGARRISRRAGTMAATRACRRSFARCTRAGTRRRAPRSRSGQQTSPADRTGSIRRSHRCGRSSSPGGRRSGAGWSCRRSIASTSTRCSRRSSASSQAPTTVIRRRLRQHSRVRRRRFV